MHLNWNEEPYGVSGNVQPSKASDAEVLKLYREVVGIFMHGKLDDMAIDDAAQTVNDTYAACEGDQGLRCAFRDAARKANYDLSASERKASRELARCGETMMRGDRVAHCEGRFVVRRNVGPV